MTGFPVPIGNPAIPYWIFQDVSLPPGVHERLPLFAVKPPAKRNCKGGDGQVGQNPVAPPVVPKCKPLAIITPSPSVISHDTSLVHEPVIQLVRFITSPVLALKFTKFGKAKKNFSRQTVMS